MRVLELKDVEKLDPSEVCLDIVLKWAETLGEPGTAKVMGSTLICCAVNHRKQKVMFNVPLSNDEPRIGRDPRWNLVQLGSTVWKLTPSVKDEHIHGYITIFGVPDPAPWRSP